MTASDARLHLRYSAWASQKVLDAAMLVPSQDLDRHVGVSHNSLLGTLVHIHFGDWIWYTRAVAPLDRPGGTLEALGTWPELLRKWVAWADTPSDEDLQRLVEYKAMDGTEHRTKTWQIILHVVNHATLHRGQAMAMLRQLGIKPPGTDLIYFYPELDKV